MRVVLSLIAMMIALMPGAAIAQKPQAVETWTAVIDYPVYAGYVYTWRLTADGKYREDGADAKDGSAIQQTLNGTWTRNGSRLVLTQEFDAFRFEGVVRGDRYSGAFYSGSQMLSKFCAWKGAKIPTGCEDDLVG